MGVITDADIAAGMLERADRTSDPELAATLRANAEHFKTVDPSRRLHSDWINQHIYNTRAANKKKVRR